MGGSKGDRVGNRWGVYIIGGVNNWDKTVLEKQLGAVLYYIINKNTFKNHK